METRGSKVYFTIEEQLASGLPSPSEINEVNVEKEQVDTAIEDIDAYSAMVADDEGYDPRHTAMTRQNLMNAVNKASVLKRMHAELNPASLEDFFKQFEG